MKNKAYKEFRLFRIKIFFGTLAMLIAAAGEAEDGEAPPNLDTGDIVR